MRKTKGPQRNSINKIRSLNPLCELEFTSNYSELTWASSGIRVIFEVLATLSDIVGIEVHEERLPKVYFEATEVTVTS